MYKCTAGVTQSLDGLYCRLANQELCCCILYQTQEIFYTSCNHFVQHDTSVEQRIRCKLSPALCSSCFFNIYMNPFLVPFSLVSTWLYRLAAIAKFRKSWQMTIKKLSATQQTLKPSRIIAQAEAFRWLIHWLSWYFFSINSFTSSTQWPLTTFVRLWITKKSENEELCRTVLCLSKRAYFYLFIVNYS